MNKFNTYICVLVLALVSSTTHAAQECTPITRSIVKTTVLTPVERASLVRLFTKENISIGSKPQDIFLAIGKFQKKYGLEVVNTIGPKTRLKMNQRLAEICATPIATPAGTSTVTTGATTSSPMILDLDPEKLELLSPDGTDNVVQGLGRGLTVVWHSKNIPNDANLTLDLVGENLESVIKTWQVKNTGKFELDHNQVDALPDGFYRFKIRHFCNSVTIACAEGLSTASFVVYPPVGFVTGVFRFKDFVSGKKYYLNDAQSMQVQWFTYDKGFDYYKIYLGNVLLNKEVLVGNSQSGGILVKGADLKNLKKDMIKSEIEIQNAYYVRAQVIRREQNGNETVLQETVSTQFALR